MIENTPKDTEQRTVSIKLPVETIDRIHEQTDCSDSDEIEAWIHRAIHKQLSNYEQSDVDKIELPGFLAECIQSDKQHRNAELDDLINDHIMLNPSVELTVTYQR